MATGTNKSNVLSDEGKFNVIWETENWGDTEREGEWERERERMRELMCAGNFIS